LLPTARFGVRQAGAALAHGAQLQSYLRGFIGTSLT
jgi:hypothetical protein